VITGTQLPLAIPVPVLAVPTFHVTLPFFWVADISFSLTFTVSFQIHGFETGTRIQVLISKLIITPAIKKNRPKERSFLLTMHFS
jgi:hypothetical protein